MDRYKDHLIEAYALGSANRWQARFAVHRFNHEPEPGISRIIRPLWASKQTAIEQALACARKLIDEER